MAQDSSPRTVCRRRRRCDRAAKQIAVAITAFAIAGSSSMVMVHPFASALSIPSPNRLATPAVSHTCPKASNHRNGMALWMAPQTPQPRRPRRMLKKRTANSRKRRNRHAEVAASGGASSSLGRTSSIGRILPGIGTSDAARTTPASSRSTQEYRPLVPSVRRDMGEDYWIDPEDLEREQRRKEEEEKRLERLAKNPKGEAMPQEKLMTEVKAPYRQNWIGYFSLIVAVLSIIVAQFPELLEPAPTIRFPDL